MRNLFSVLPFVALTFFCWGMYGPILHEGQYAMGADGVPSSLRPLICVGIAYFIIAVLFPIGILKTKGEKGNWTTTGFIWSFAAGIAGAIGALGIILAFKFKGKPVYVMPLVFGLAPVVNTFVTMFMARSFKQASTVFYIGVLIVAVGAAGVMFFKPTKPHAASSSESVTQTEGHTDHDDAEKSGTEENGPSEPKIATSQTNYALVSLFIGLTALCWGSYGPGLHKGQAKRAGSKLRPLLCVGLAYFAVAVVIPIVLMPTFPEPGGFPIGGTLWSLGAGAAGALGALGIIYAFNFGGKPIFVMPLVFGGAPVVNTVTTTITSKAYGEISPLFIMSLLLVICGAITVLIFAPRPSPPPKPTAH